MERRTLSSSSDQKEEREREREREKTNIIEDDGAMEQVFKNTEIPSWKNQITMRAMFTSFVLSIVFNFIVCKLNPTTGVIPSLNVAAGLLGFAIISSWTALIEK